MAQHDMNIANQSFPSFRTDLNNSLSALNSMHSGTSRPSGATTGTMWLDTTNSGSNSLIIKFFDGSDDITFATINTSANTVDFSDSSIESVTFKEGGTNFTDSLLLGHATSGTLDAAIRNTGVGSGALDALTSGDKNTAVGRNAGGSINTGSRNTLLGQAAGQSITSAEQNAIFGDSAMTTNTSGGSYNSALGAGALASVDNGDYNLAVGWQAGDALTSGTGNVIIGANADASSNTGDRQLVISGYDGSTTTTWISGDSSGNVTTSGTLTSSTGLVKTVGKETIWIPAVAMYPNTTNGAESAQVELSNAPELKVLDFDKSSDEFAQFAIAFPKSWNAGTITFQAFFTATSTNTGTTAWGLSGVALADNGDLNTAFGTQVVATAKAHSGTSNDLDVSAESGAVTIAGSPADNEYVFFQVSRDVSADDLDADARLLGIKLFYTTDSSNDS